MVVPLAWGSLRRPALACSADQRWHHAPNSAVPLGGSFIIEELPMALADGLDYDRLSQLLTAVELAPSPAEAQGMLCGLLALHLPDSLERWHAQLVVGPAAELAVESAGDLDVHPDAAFESLVDAETRASVIDLTFQGRAVALPAEAGGCCEGPGHDHASAHASAHAHAHAHSASHVHAGHHDDAPDHCRGYLGAEDGVHDGAEDGVHVDAHEQQSPSAATEAEERRAALEQLAVWTQAAIGPTSLSFELFLPADDRPLHERASAVLDWVRGLLFGLALGGLGQEQRQGQTAEVFDDLVELTRMDLDAIADSDADEQALTEIVEFLRVAAMLIREERGKALIDERDRQAATRGIH
jgi:uncharacterized protein YgfB (UPF0149 family)